MHLKHEVSVTAAAGAASDGVAERQAVSIMWRPVQRARVNRLLISCNNAACLTGAAGRRRVGSGGALAWLATPRHRPCGAGDERIFLNVLETLGAMYSCFHRLLQNIPSDMFYCGRPCVSYTKDRYILLRFFFSNAVLGGHRTELKSNFAIFSEVS